MPHSKTPPLKGGVFAFEPRNTSQKAPCNGTTDSVGSHVALPERNMRTNLLIVAVSASLLFAACGKKHNASESTLGDAISADMKTSRGESCA